MDQFLDAAVFAGATASNGKRSANAAGTDAHSPVTSPTVSASTSGGTRVY